MLTTACDLRQPVRAGLVFKKVEQETEKMSSPSKDRGRMGRGRNTNFPPLSQSSENPKPTAKTRKRKPAKSKLLDRRKQRGLYKPKSQDPIVDSLPPIGVGDPDLAECIFSDEEERAKFLQECTQDSPLFGPQPSLSLHLTPSPLVEITDFAECDVIEECYVPSAFCSSEGFSECGISIESGHETEELSQGVTTSSFSPQAWMLHDVSNVHASEWSATEQTETQRNPVLDESVSSGEAVSNSSDEVQLCETPCTNGSVHKENHTLPIGGGAVPPTSIIRKALDNLRKTLPPRWTPIADESGIHLCRFPINTPYAVQREIILSFGGDPKIFVHCKALPHELDLLKSVEVTKVALNIESIDQFCIWGASIARTLERYSICIGADLLELKDIWKDIASSTVDKNPCQEETYSETCRSDSCPLLIPFRKGKRCAPCAKLLRSLKKRSCHLLSKVPHPSTPNIHLTFQQALHKLKIQHDEIRSKDSKIAYLEGKVKNLLDIEGVDLEDTLSTDLANVLAKAELTRAQAILFREQFYCSGKANARAHRWHPYLIRLALRLTSRSACEALRNSGSIKLPSSRTLFDYSRVFEADAGISEEILKLAMARSDKYKKSHQKFVSLMADEMHIFKNLVYRQSDGNLVGFVHLDKVEEEMEKLETELNGKEELSRPNFATKMLAFMIKGCTSSVKYVVASYLVSSISKDMLYTRTWNLISRLERAGIKVLAFVSDGCAVNRGFINMHTPFTKTKSEVIFDTINFCSADRRILYFISDVVHILKTIRNSFYSSGDGKKNARCMEIKGEKIVWKTIVRLYLTYKQFGFRKSFKLSSQNVFPNSYSIMKVNLAAEVLSDTVALNLEQQKWPSTTETVKFIRNCNKFFDCLNGAHTSQPVKTGNENLAPYNRVDDFRFKWLEEFLDYLESWEKEVKMMFEPQEWSKKMIARQTLEGIEMSVKSITGAIRFLLEQGADFVNPRTFSQDHQE